MESEFRPDINRASAIFNSAQTSLPADWSIPEQYQEHIRLHLRNWTKTQLHRAIMLYELSKGSQGEYGPADLILYIQALTLRPRLVTRSIEHADMQDTFDYLRSLTERQSQTDQQLKAPP